jgi:hypothetical protein
MTSSICMRAEVTAGVQRAVGFRRLGTTLDVALRYRFAYSLEHYNSVTDTLITPEANLGPLRSQRVRSDYNTLQTTERQGYFDLRQGKLCRLDSLQGPSYDESSGVKQTVSLRRYPSL